MDYLKNQIDWNDHYTLRGYTDYTEYARKLRLIRREIGARGTIMWGDRYEVIKFSSRIPAKGEAIVASINAIARISALADKMGVRYDNLKYFILFSKL